MFEDTNAFSGFSVNDLGRAREFYGETLGIETEIIDEQYGLMTLHLAGDRGTLVYAAEGHRPGSYTVLNFQVEDIDEAVDGLAERGVSFERYEGAEQDEKGVMRGMGPNIAWFKDPAGNVLSVIEQD